MSAPHDPVWTPRDGIGWARSNFLWGFQSGAFFCEGVFFLLNGTLLPAAFFFVAAALVLRCAKQAKRPLFVADRHVKDYQ